MIYCAQTSSIHLHASFLHKHFSTCTHKRDTRTFSCCEEITRSPFLPLGSVLTVCIPVSVHMHNTIHTTVIQDYSKNSTSSSSNSNSNSVGGAGARRIMKEYCDFSRLASAANVFYGCVRMEENAVCVYIYRSVAKDRPSSHCSTQYIVLYYDAISVNHYN